MISIIICSVNLELLHQLQTNIGETIGVPFEIIAIDNRDGQDGICKVYNKGGDMARYEILCFVHEDVLFRTMDWGPLLVKHFSDRATGLVGVAGGDSMGAVPATWSSSFRSDEVNLIQHLRPGAEERKRLFATGTDGPMSSKRVQVLDGVFLATSKPVFNLCRFDEKNLPGFHGYDIDYSLQVSARYEIRVIFDILISHFSMGNLDRRWLESTLVVNRKWKKILPVSVYPLTTAEFTFYHWKLLRIFLGNLFRLDYSNRQILWYFFRFSFGKYFVLRRFLSMGKYVVLSMYRRSGFYLPVIINSLK